MPTPITERFIDVDGIRTFVRERAGDGPPTVFVHGNPTHSADWLPFLAAVEGPVIAFDLPGFGRSERPGGDRFDHSMGSYGRFVAGLLEELAPAGYRLVVHDWGAVALLAAQQRPEALHRLVVINAVPYNRDYRWHWLARLWRRRGLGEAFSAIATRSGTEQLLRLARPGRRPMPPEFVDMIWEHFDAGTRRAVLGLYRSADPDVLEAGGEFLERLDCPALIVWGTEDPYLSIDEGRFYERRLPRGTLRAIPDAGHWPWIDDPSVISMVADFLAGRQPPSPAAGG